MRSSLGGKISFDGWETARESGEGVARTMKQFTLLILAGTTAFILAGCEEEYDENCYCRLDSQLRLLAGNPGQDYRRHVEDEIVQINPHVDYAEFPDPFNNRCEASKNKYGSTSEEYRWNVHCDLGPEAPTDMFLFCYTRRACHPQTFGSDVFERDAPALEVLVAETGIAL